MGARKVAAEKSKRPARVAVKVLQAEVVAIETLKPHPRNYRKHTDEQLAHITASLKANDFYRNVVCAADWTILAGHGVVEAAKKIGLKVVSAVRMDLKPDDQRALRILAGDNEIARGAEVDERGLAKILTEIGHDPAMLLGTGFSELDVARLVEIGRIVDPGAEWEGMPEFVQKDKGAFRQILVSFRSEKDAQAFAKLIGQSITESTRALWYPKAKIDHVRNLRYKAKA